MKTTIEQLPLTPKQQRFCDEYLKDMNATRAALAAGYSRTTALNGQLMTLPKIKAYIKLRVKKTSTKMELARDEFLTELRRIAFANMGDYFDDDNKLKPMSELTRDQKAAIWNIRVTENAEGSHLQLRLNNKLSALEKLAKHLGFYHLDLAEPEIEYKYLDKETLDEDDRFEDDSMKSEIRDRKSEEEDDEPEVKDGRWERDKAIFMEQELEKLKRELPLQMERARLEAEAAGDVKKAAQADACASATSNDASVVTSGTLAVATSRCIGTVAAATVAAEVPAEPVKVIGHFPGQYTPEGYLIKTDMPADRDTSDPYYDPFAGRYIEKKTGTMLIKSYLTSPPDEVMDLWRRTKAAMFKGLKVETLEG